MENRSRLALILIVLIFAAATLLPQVGKSPREVSPEIVRQMERQAYPSVPSYQVQIARELAALRQSVEDQGHRIDLHRTEIDALQPEVEAVRIAALEREMTAVREEKAAREKERKADHEAMMQWFRGIGSGVLVAVILVGFNAILAHQREVRREAQMRVLTMHTDGMTEQIARLAEAKGHLDERNVIETAGK